MENFYYKKVLTGKLEEVRNLVETSFKKEGFGVITEIKMHEKFKEKLNVDFPPYIILGICNPEFAYEAVKQEENIGVFLPCKIVLKQKPEDMVEVIVLNPHAPMQLLNNESLNELTQSVSEILERAMKHL